jgi:polar amino acid transport system substrate-binding protein/arginine/ornithine transport system substrate-binding protein
MDFMRRLLGAGILAAGALAGLPAAAELGVCVEGTRPPFSETRPDGSITGFDIDIAHALCGEIAETCHLVKTSWDEMIPALEDGKCDAIVASMPDTAERRKEIDFTDIYYKAPVRFVARAGAAMTDTAEGMKDKVVGVQRGTVDEAYMAAHYPGTPLRLYDDLEQALRELALGRLDAVLGEAPALDVGFLRTSAGEGYAFVGTAHFDPAIQGSGAAIGVRKADVELRDRLSAAIAAIRDDGTYDDIAGRYFDFDIFGE